MITIMMMKIIKNDSNNNDNDNNLILNLTNIYLLNQPPSLSAIPPVTITYNQSVLLLLTVIYYHYRFLCYYPSLSLTIAIA